VNPGALPGDADLYAGYDDGSYDDAAAIAAKEGGKIVFRITVRSSDNEGDVLDVEKGDATPADAPGWVQRRRQAGHPNPGAYCSLSAWPAVRQAFTDAKVVEPWYWVAAYPGNGANLYPGAAAHQYVDHGGYDESVFVDYIPGIDPPPHPSDPPPGPIEIGDNMKSYNVSVALKGGKGWIPAPENVAGLVNVWFTTENPDKVGHYDTTPQVWSASATPGPSSPNGAIVVEGMVPDATYGAVLVFGS
jgi:hypothetical protein